jgi:hypothetical protein
MRLSPAVTILLAAVLCGGFTGCQKSGPTKQALTPTVLPANTIASVHWRGKRWLGYEATAFFFMRIWNLPQTVQFENQTLEKLAAFPADYFHASGPSSNGVVAVESRMLPLLKDLEQEETYLEISAASNAAPELVLAVHLDAEDPQSQCDRWSTNLSAMLAPLAAHPASSVKDSWTLPLTNASALNRIEFHRSGRWALLGLAAGDNSLLKELSGRIQRDGVPFVSGGTNLWLEATVAPNRLASAFPALTAQILPETKALRFVHIRLTGDGANVITRATAGFVKPLPENSGTWQLPLPLLHEPLTSFAAVRGLQSLLANWPVGHALPIGTPPNQLFTWSSAGSPFQVYLAAPFPDARQQVSNVSDWLLQQGNPWLAGHGYIQFDRAPEGNGVTWGNLPNIRPFIASASAGTNSWLYAGLLPDNNTAPAPAGLIQDLLGRTNLVYYGWELTGSRLQPCLELGQTIRLVTRHRQMDMNSVSLNLLATLIPRLGTSTTVVSRSSPAELTFYRRSTLGLTAPELHLLADWLESSNFPYGLHSSAQ